MFRWYLTVGIITASALFLPGLSIKAMDYSGERLRAVIEQQNDILIARDVSICLKRIKGYCVSWKSLSHANTGAVSG